MNSTEAKKLSLPDIMASLGYQPIKVVKSGNELWYHSPFRAEKEPSFHTSFLGGKWIWNDFGDKGGTVIDFIMRHENYYSVSEALQYLERFGKTKISSSKPLFSFQKQPKKQEIIEEAKELELINTTTIKNPIIIDYLTKTRKVTKDVAFHYLKEVKYKNLNNQKEYFAFGIENVSKGYEIRVASDKYPFKSALIKKDISFFQGNKEHSGIINIFEGMTDFLSILSHLKTSNLAGDSIILHSTKLLDRSIEWIQRKPYPVINGFFDNDKTGRKANTKLSKLFPNQFQDKSTLYHPCKDVNEWHIKQYLRQNDSLYNR